MDSSDGGPESFGMYERHKPMNTEQTMGPVMSTFPRDPDVTRGFYDDDDEVLTHIRETDVAVQHAQRPRHPRPPPLP